MRAGFSYADLKNMPLTTWGTFYRHAQAYRMEDFRTMLSVLNPGKDPRKMHQNFTQQIDRLAKPSGPENILRDPRKARSFMAGLGVKVIAKPAEATE